MKLTPETRDEFIEEIRNILMLQNRHRSAMGVLENRMRGLDWKGWSSVVAFVQLCREHGFFVYEGLGKRHRKTNFISMDPAPESEPDYFVAVGFVIAVGEGVWVNRSHPPGSTSVRAAAFVWKTQSGVDRYCDKHDHLRAAIQRTRDLDDGAA